MDNACDILCLQETWTIDSNINILGNIHNDFLFTGISGVDHTVAILQGRPKGGVALLYRKSLCCYIKHIYRELGPKKAKSSSYLHGTNPQTNKQTIKHIKISHRRACAISITIDNVSCIILSVYMPCDTYLVNTVNSEFVDCILRMFYIHAILITL